MLPGAGTFDVGARDDVRELGGEGDHAVVRGGGGGRDAAEAEVREEPLEQFERGGGGVFAGGEDHARALIEVGVRAGKAPAFPPGHRMPADEAEPVFRAEIGEVFHGEPLDAAQVDQEGAGPELADVLPHEGDRLLRVEGEKDQVAHRQIVFRDGLVDRAVRVRTYESIVKGHNVPKPGVPESFKVLVKELQSLCLDMKVLDENGSEIELRDDDEDNYQPGKFRDDDDDFYGYNAGGESDFAAAGYTLKEGSDDDDLVVEDEDGDDDAFDGDDFSDDGDLE